MELEVEEAEALFLTFWELCTTLPSFCFFIFFLTYTHESLRFTMQIQPQNMSQKNLDNLDNFGVWHEAYSFPFQQLAFIAFFLPIYLPFTIVFLPLLFPLLFARRVGFFLQHFFHPRGLEKRRLRHRAWRLFLLSFSILRLTRVWFFAWARHFDLFAKKRGQHNSATITTE